MKTNNITKEQFDSLFSDSITKKEYDRIIGLIEDRCDDIVLEMLTSKSNRFWWDFDNCDYDSEDSGGFFDPKEYKKFVGIGGEYVNFPEPYASMDTCGNPAFPTRWLWEENWKEEFDEEVKAYKAQLLAKKEKIKKMTETREKNRKSLRASAFAKLTSEERWAVGLKKI